MNNKDMKKKYRSIIRRIVIIPLAILLPINVLTIFMSVNSINDAEMQMIQQDVSVLEMSANQIGGELDFIDKEINQFVTSSISYMSLAGFNLETPQADILSQSFAVKDWMTDIAGMNENIGGLFFYFPKSEYFMLSGNGRQSDFHAYIESYLKTKPERLQSWQIINIGDGYLTRIRFYNGGYCGAWVALPALLSNWSLGEQNFVQTSFLTNMPDIAIADTAVYYSIDDKLQVSEQGFGKKGNELYIVPISVNNLYIGISVSQANIFAELPWVTKLILILTILAMFATPLIVRLLFNSAVKPIRKIESAMQRIGSGDKNYRIPEEHKSYENEFDRLSHRLNQMVDDLDELDNNLYQTKIQQQKIKMKYISQQIRPHFILNALNLLYTYGPEEYHLSQKMTMFLSEYFRYIVYLQQDLVELKKEFQHTKNYLAIQKERYPDRLMFTVKFESRVKDCLIPPLIIQTFVENSIKYGFKDGKKTYIYVLAREMDDRLLITIGDTGNGAPEDMLEKIQDFLDTRIYHEDLGIGIQNAVERMDILYGERTDIQIANQEGGGISVEIRLPMRKEQPNV